MLSSNISSIKDTLSAARMSTYEYPNGRNGRGIPVEDALKLYLWNAQISAAFIYPIQVCEVTIRNAIAQAIENKYNNRWIWDSKFYGRLTGENKKIIEIMQKKMPQNAYAQIDVIIPEFSLAFWQSLLTKRYENDLWKSYLRACFPYCDSAKNISTLREEIYDGLNKIRLFRNRIAHHEPIFKYDAGEYLNLILQMINWRCHVTSEWVARNQLVTYLIATKPQLR